MRFDLTPEELALAQALWQARAARRAIEEWPANIVSDRSAAYRVQAAVTQASGLPIAGWKIGAVWDQAQALLGLDRPFAGPIPENAVVVSGSSVDAPETPLLLEAEIAVKLAGDVAHDMAPTEVAEALGSIAASFEIVTRRVSGAPNGEGYSFIADGGVHGATVLGTDQPVAAYDPKAPVRLITPTGETIGPVSAAAHGWPDLVAPIAWLAKELDGIGAKLKQGQLVMIGTITPPLPVQSSGLYRVEIEGLSAVTVDLRC